jgi:hypothetical protein
MTNNQLVLTISDPWDFQSAYPRPLIALGEVKEDQAWLLKLVDRITYKGISFDHLVATARHSDLPLRSVNAQSDLPVNLTPVASGEQRLGTNELFSAAEKWRGWHLVGGMRMR